jgi:hypothetical protein
MQSALSGGLTRAGHLQVPHARPAGRDAATRSLQRVRCQRWRERRPRVALCNVGQYPGPRLQLKENIPAHRPGLRESQIATDPERTEG